MNIKMTNISCTRVKEENIRALACMFSLVAMYSLKTEVPLSFITCRPAKTRVRVEAQLQSPLTSALESQLCCV